MSNTESTTSVNPSSTTPSNLSSKLVQSGLKKTPLATAIAELIGSYLGTPPNLPKDLLVTLQSTRENATAAISKNIPEKAINDEIHIGTEAKK